MDVITVPNIASARAAAGRRTRQIPSGQPFIGQRALVGDSADGARLVAKFTGAHSASAARSGVAALRASRMVFAGVKVSFFDAAMVMASPVPGLRPEPGHAKRWISAAF